MSVQLQHKRVGDWRAIELNNDSLKLVVIPEIGGKIISLQSQRTGREWLWTNPHLPLAKPPADATDFGAYDSGGWDEIFPTVNPCRVPGSAWGERQFTDHGELWYRSWEVLTMQVNENQSITLRLAVDDLNLPFRFQRTLTLAPGSGGLQVDYELTNRSDLPLPYIWAAHPLIAIEPGDEILLPFGTTMSSTGSVGLSLASDSLPSTWPRVRLASDQTLDLSQVPERSAAFAIKLFARNMASPTVEIANHKGAERLKVSFSFPVSHCGLWLNCGAWSGADTAPYFNLGIEPTTSPHDSLTEACTEDLAIVAPPLSSQQWHIEIGMG